MSMFSNKDREKSTPFEFTYVTLSADPKETYTESATAPGCFHKRIFWEAEISNIGHYYANDKFFKITGEGDTKAKAIVAAVEALLAK